MKVSPRGADFIKSFEGLKLDAYRDQADIWTIGYGHTGPDVKPGMRITEREAEALFARDVAIRERIVSSLVSAPLNQNEFDALVSFVYNVGEGAFKRSTALRRLNRGDRIGAADALTWFNKTTIGGILTRVNGLVRRRAAERAIFLEPAGPVDPQPAPRVAESMRAPAVEDPPRRAKLSASRTLQGAVVSGGAGAAALSMNGDAPDGPSATLETEPDSEPTAPTSPPATQTETAQPAPQPPFDEAEVEAQLQIFLMIIVLIGIAVVIFARIDDWRNFRR